MFDRFAVGVVPIAAGVPAGSSVPPGQGDAMEVEGLVGVWDPRFDDFIEKTRVVTSYQCTLCKGWITNKSKDCIPAHLGRVVGLPLPPRVSYKPCSEAKQLPLPIAQACWAYFSYPLHPSMFDEFAAADVPSAAGVPSAGASIPPEQEEDLNASMVLDDLLASLELEHLVGTPWNEEHVSPHWHFAQPPVLPSSHHTALFPALSQPQPQPQFSPLSGHVGSWDSQVGGTLQGGGSSAPGHAGGWVSQLGVAQEVGGSSGPGHAGGLVSQLGAAQEVGGSSGPGHAGGLVSQLGAAQEVGGSSGPGHAGGLVSQLGAAQEVGGSSGPNVIVLINHFRRLFEQMGQLLNDFELHYGGAA
ncbi:hypothetical protein CDL15_Pgr002372 [Punica granatum]|uniref:Uncharacterized protein n=1 Tax=Punica granatum TaxID=22663 RepID=A0A218XTX3_PUNGR|nr:hypothetical protein CDL15_Pgr002372 [Punica granatum]